MYEGTKTTLDVGDVRGLTINYIQIGRTEIQQQEDFLWCLKCGAEFEKQDISKWNYCPSCGRPIGNEDSNGAESGELYSF